MIVCSIISSVLLDAMMIDVVAIVIVWLGVCVYQGSRRACSWSFAFMLIYLLLAAVLFVAGTLAPEYLRISGRIIPPDQLPWIQMATLLFATWSIANIVLLVRTRKLSTTTSDLPAPSVR